MFGYKQMELRSHGLDVNTAQCLTTQLQYRFYIN